MLNIAQLRPPKDEDAEAAEDPVDEDEVIRLRNIDVWYGDTHAIKDVSLDVPPRKVTALIGPSGCGKSTLLRTLNRMNDEIPGCRTTGSVQWRGVDILASDVDPVPLRRDVGMVFQKPNPFPKSIYDNVAYGLRVGGITNKNTLDETGERSLRDAAIWDEVTDRLGDSAMGLSGGQQQRICIARTLAVEPEVILMDEPASALDPIATGKIEDLIYELKKDYTVVIVTHEPDIAAYARRVVTMMDGVITSDEPVIPPAPDQSPYDEEGDEQI